MPFGAGAAQRSKRTNGSLPQREQCAVHHHTAAGNPPEASRFAAVPSARTSSAAVQRQGCSRLLRRSPPCLLLQEERLELTEVRLRSQQEDFEAHLEKLRATHEEAEVLRRIFHPCSAHPANPGPSCTVSSRPRHVCCAIRSADLTLMQQWCDVQQRWEKTTARLEETLTSERAAVLELRGSVELLRVCHSGSLPGGVLGRRRPAHADARLVGAGGKPQARRGARVAREAAVEGTAAAGAGADLPLRCRVHRSCRVSTRECAARALIGWARRMTSQSGQVCKSRRSGSSGASVSSSPRHAPFSVVGSLYSTMGRARVSE